MQDVAELMMRAGPFATIALRAPSAIEQAADRLALRWRNCRHAIAGSGLSAERLADLDEAAASLDHAAGRSVVMIQPADAPVLVEYLDDESEGDLAVVDRLPRVGPVLESRQRSVAHVMVVADRVGADIVGVGLEAGPEHVETEGESLHIHRGNPGGWSQRRYQQRAENRWESNATLAAEQATAMARRLDARVMTVAGDVRAVAFLLDHLPDDVAGITRKLEGQSLERVASETVRAVADVVARDTKALIDRFREDVGNERAANGADPTLEALSNGRVDVLLVHDDADDARRARFDPDGAFCSTGPTVRPSPDAELDDGRLVDVAIRSAYTGGAEVRFVPRHGGPADGLGALLRW